MAPEREPTDEELVDLQALRAERDALRARLEALERERAVEMRRAAAVMADAQRRVYWLDRWHLDLNALLATRAGAGFRRLLWAGRVSRRGLRRLADRLTR
jgi:hypothetical protein